MNTAVAEAAALEIPQATPSLRSNFKWTFTGNVVYAACQWGMLSVLAKAGNAAIVGQFALGLAIAAPVFMFSNLQLRAVQATDARSEYEFADYFTLRVLASLLGLGVVAALAWRLNYDATTRWVVLLVAASKAVESLSDVVAGLLQKHERLNQVAISLMVRGVLSLAAFGTTFLRTRSLLAGVAALVATWSTVFVLYDLWRTRGVLGGQRRYFRVDGARLRRLLVVSAPLGVVMTLISFNVNIPRYMLVKYLGEADLGIFASLAYVLVAMTLIAHALGQAASARLSRMFAADDIPGFKRATGKLLLMGAAILIAGPVGALLFGRPVLRLVYGPLYAEHVGLFALMAVTAGLHCVSTFLIYAITAARSFRVQAVMKTIAICITVTLSFLLIPRYGLTGAAIALLISEAMFVIGMAQSLAVAIRRGAKA
jgi:O-antigen/teichoic acid export membrane protein